MLEPCAYAKALRTCDTIALVGVEGVGQNMRGGDPAAAALTCGKEIIVSE